MPEIGDVMDVTIDDLSLEQQAQLKDAIDQFQQKCLMLFSKTEVASHTLSLTCPGFCSQGNLIPHLFKRNKRL
jgi:hypothetical protein